MSRAWGHGSDAKLVQALALFALATAVCARSAEADQLPLRVCADPNNLPYSNSAGDGFENKIVELVADYLHRPLEFVWRAERRGFVREGLNAGECDLVAAIPSGARMALATRPYYRSTYVFVSKPGEPPVSSLDDPSLRMRKIGVQLIGDDGMNSPPAHALAERGIVEQRARLHGLRRLPQRPSAVRNRSCGRHGRGRCRGCMGAGRGLFRARTETAVRRHVDRGLAPMHPCR